MKMTIGTDKANALIATALEHFTNCDEVELNTTDEDVEMAERLARLFRAGIAIVVINGLTACAPLRDYAPGTATPAQAWERTRDPFGPEPISYGSIFGPQPEPGKVTVQP